MGYSHKTKKVAGLGAAAVAGLLAGQMFLGSPAPTVVPEAPLTQRSVLSEVGQADISYNVAVGKNGYTVTGVIITGNKQVPYTVFIPKALNGKATIRTAE